MGDQDDKIKERIQKFLYDVYKYNETKTIFIKFKIKGHIYTTKFYVSMETHPEESTPHLSLVLSSVSNDDVPCISLTHFYYTYHTKPNKYESIIQSNANDKHCFNPVLKSNTASKNERVQVRATDVLQVLATKLRLCFPNHAEIEITDLATIQMVRITPFNVLRGKPGIYEKYGYVSPAYNTLRTQLPKITWSQIKNEPDYVLYGKEHTIQERVEAITKKKFDDSTPIMDIMRQISFEMENEYNNALYTTIETKHTLNKRNNTTRKRPRNEKTNNTPHDTLLYTRVMLSETIVFAIARILGIKTFDLQEFTLDEWSDKWQSWDDALQFLEFDEVTIEGNNGSNTNNNKKRYRNYNNNNINNINTNNNYNNNNTNNGRRTRRRFR